MRSVRMAAVVVVCLGAAGSLPAQTIRYVAQERSVQSSVSDEYYSEEGTVYARDSDRVDATGFGPFDGRANSHQVDPVYPSGYSNMSQRSTLEETGISVAADWSNQAFTDN